MDRKRELKEQYKQMKPAMGVFSIQSKVDGRCYLEETVNLKSGINRAVFQLNWGSHPNKELQNDWKKHGEDSFIVEILDELAYSEANPTADYSDDLAELVQIWREKLRQDGTSFYSKNGEW
jgi:hypothetical protein